MKYNTFSDDNKLSPYYAVLRHPQKDVIIFHDIQICNKYIFYVTNFFQIHCDVFLFNIFKSIQVEFPVFL